MQQLGVVLKLDKLLIDKARKLNRVACENMDEGDLDSVAGKLTEAISLAPNLAEPTPIWAFCFVGKGNLLEVSRIGVPIGTHAVWCEIVE